ncbi:TetR-like C-terminal domain-containing protein [Streptomyces sp. NBC_00859]|uniref:TetR-like C-terminal domain-containing protein n=1 Tax=Streptomyces sp. NBC_00859 TaxID=2903682 RepID=UPI00386607A6|nr:TetR/AcrR family transcriptional regulator C-terminal ligand-binding domain-containing protein [Streptomyces sp. NBC_00859]
MDGAGNVLHAFIAAVFAGSRHPETAPVLLALVREAGTDPELAQLVKTFTEERRVLLRKVLTRGLERGELRADPDLDLMVDQVYGVFWYRFLLGHAPLNDEAADRLADSLVGSTRRP